MTITTKHSQTVQQFMNSKIAVRVTSPKYHINAYFLVTVASSKHFTTKKMTELLGDECVIVVFFDTVLETAQGVDECKISAPWYFEQDRTLLDAGQSPNSVVLQASMGVSKETPLTLIHNVWTPRRRGVPGVLVASTAVFSKDIAAMQEMKDAAPPPRVAVKSVPKHKPDDKVRVTMRCSRWTSNLSLDMTREDSEFFNTDILVRLTGVASSTCEVKTYNAVHRHSPLKEDAEIHIPVPGGHRVVKVKAGKDSKEAVAYLNHLFASEKIDQGETFLESVIEVGGMITNGEFKGIEARFQLHTPAAVDEAIAHLRIMKRMFIARD